MTLLELLVVLGVIGMAMFLGYYLVSAVTKSALRDDTVEVAAALKGAHNLAAQSGMHHRVVFDLDKQTYRIEICPDPIQIKRGDQEEVIDKEALEKTQAAFPAVDRSANGTPEAVEDQPAAVGG